MSETPKLKRNLGLWGVTSLGIANIIGAGIFVISGVAAGLAGPSVIFSFLIAGSIALMAALSYAELSSFVHETGASYAFTKRAFGRFWSFVVGWFNYFDYIVGAAAVSIGFAAYFTESIWSSRRNGINSLSSRIANSLDDPKSHWCERGHSCNYGHGVHQNICTCFIDNDWRILYLDSFWRNTLSSVFSKWFWWDAQWLCNNLLCLSWI